MIAVVMFVAGYAVRSFQGFSQPTAPSKAQSLADEAWRKELDAYIERWRKERAIEQDLNESFRQQQFENAARSIFRKREYITGPRGGCYYINRNGNKTYVDRSMCQ